MTGERSPGSGGRETALVASRSGGVPDWFEATVAALGYDVTGTLSVDRPEHGRYNLPPGLVDRLAERARTADISLVAVDELLHPGQMVDLDGALPVTVRDRRGVVWQRLGGVADDCLALRDCRLERRRAAGAERDSAGQAPSGGGGRVADLDRREQELRARRDECRGAARERVSTAYDGVDARVVLVGPPAARTTRLWAGLTDEPGDPSGPVHPPEPRTAVTTVGPHEVAVTDTPGLVEGLPAWYTDAVPGTIAALEAADVVVVVSEGERFRQLDERFEATVVSVREPVDVEAVRARLAAALPSARVELTLPHGDETQALVSWLYDTATVADITYGEGVTATVTVPVDRVTELERRVSRVGGGCERVTPSDASPG